MNKALYSLSYTLVTAGAAGILFTGVYVLVREGLRLGFVSLSTCGFMGIVFCGWICRWMYTGTGGPLL